MDQLRKAFSAIGAQLGGLTATHRLLVGSLLVIAVLTLFLVAQYTGSPVMVELMPGVSAEAQARSREFLLTSGVRFEDRAGSIYVAPGDRSHVQAQLAEAGRLPSDTRLLFRNLIEQQAWYLSRQQSEQLYTIALQNELASVIAGIRGVRDATVIIDHPERVGLGAPAVRPSASATVFTLNGQPMPQATVDAVAGLIAGACTGLTVENVRVIDGSSGRQRKAASEDDVLPSAYLEQSARVESAMQQKIIDLLSYIPGRVVAVTAQVDITRQSTTTRRHLEKGDGTVSLIKRASETTSESGEAPGGAEPGVRSNQALDISRAGGSGGTTSQNQEDRDYESHVGSRVEEIIDPRGMPTSLFVSINVPHAYVVSLLRLRAAPGGAADQAPAEAEVTKLFDTEVKPRILESVMPQVLALTARADNTDAAEFARQMEGRVAVALMPSDTPVVAAGLPGGVIDGGSAGGRGGGPLNVSGGLIERVALGALGVMSLGMMIFMVKRSAGRAELPTPEELVGVPPPLEAGADVVGEAEEGNAPMAGIEVGEAELESQNMLEQVADLVERSPESAAGLIQRWMAAEH